MGSGPVWQIETEWPVASRAERARVDDQELIVLQIAADGAWPEEIRWEIYGPPNYALQLATGYCDAFDQAKIEVVRAWRDLNAHHPDEALGK